MNILQVLKSSINTLYVKYINKDGVNTLPIYYIGGSQSLPPPLSQKEEEEALKNWAWEIVWLDKLWSRET